MSSEREISSPQLESNDLVRATFGEVLAAHRIAAGYDQRPFSRLVGISNSHLRKIETGETSPTLVTLYKIASVLEEDAGTLVIEMDGRIRAKSGQR